MCSSEYLPGIHFDEKGVCNYCHQWQPVTVFGEEALFKVLKQYRGNGKEFDCIVPLSGGRDSTYVLYQLVTKYNMKALALTVDSGFILPEGIRNIEAVIRKLEVPHVWLRNEEEIKVAQRNTAIKFRGWLKKPSINAVVPVLNSGDKTMNLQMYCYAAKHSIPLVMGGNIVGNSKFEQEYWKTGFMGIFPDARGVYSAPDKIKLSLKFAWEYFSAPYNYHWPIFSEYTRGLAVYLFDSLLKPHNIASLGFYDYIYWNEQEIVATITQECDWRGASDHTTTWRIDDSAYPLINYIYLKLVGFTEHDEMYSRMIREGQLTREDAIERLIKDHQSEWINGKGSMTCLKTWELKGKSWINH
jgi:hypothetical protein